MPTTCSSKILEGWRPPYNATVVERLLAAGAVPVGKTNLDEFAMGSSTENSAFGPTRNPLDPSRVPGGSSGGSAAAVAAGMTPLALGSDTGGSIRQPAALCGLVGREAHLRSGLALRADRLRELARPDRPVRDERHGRRALLEVIAGHDPMDSTSLPEPSPSLVAHLDDGVAGQARRAGARARRGRRRRRGRRGAAARPQVLGDAGATVVELSVPELALGLSAYYLIAPAEASSNLARYDGVRYGLRVDADDVTAMNEATRTAGFGAEVKRRIMLGHLRAVGGLLRRLLRPGAQGAHADDRRRSRAPTGRPTCCSARRRRRWRSRFGAKTERPDGDVPVGRLHDPHQPVG